MARALYRTDKILRKSTTIQNELTLGRQEKVGEIYK